MKKMNSVLDERQENELLKVERNGCWFAFWGLLAAIFIQMIFFGNSFSQIAGEWIVFMLLAVYLSAACMRRGIWARNFTPDPKTNAAFSAVAGAAVAVLVFAVAYMRRPDAIKACLSLAAVSAVIMFVITMIALTLSASATKKRQEALDREPEDEDM